MRRICEFEISTIVALSAALSACGGDQIGALPQGPSGIHVQQALLATPSVVIAATDRSFEFQPNVLTQTPFFSSCPERPETGNYGEAESGGARRVRVAYPGFAEPLYGILAFCGIDPNFHGAVSRSYQIQVPQDKVADTSEGRMSVVFEQYTPPDRPGVNLPAWILWLSRQPIPSQGGAPASSGGEQRVFR